MGPSQPTSFIEKEKSRNDRAIELPPGGGI